MNGFPKYCALLLIVGCAPASDFVEVTGNVTWNGAPMPSGMVVLHPVDSQVAAVGGQIRDGKFSVRGKPGKARVLIEAVRATDQVDPATGTKLGEMYVPARYNSQSTLEVDVSSDGSNHFEFPLKDKG
jgi:hypothetical protein